MVHLRWSTAVLPKLVSELYQKEKKSFIPRPPSALFLMRVVFFILAGFCFQIKSNTILLTSVVKFFWSLHNAGDEYKFGEGYCFNNIYSTIYG